LKQLAKRRPHPFELLGRPIAEHSARMLGQMLDGVAIDTENIMVEHHSPHRALFGGQGLYRVDRVQQRIVRIADPWLRVVPPIVDEQVYRLERIDRVPPVKRNVDRVARLELRDLRLFLRFLEAGKPLQVRVIRIHQADRSPGRRQLERTDVEVLELFGWKQGKTAPPGNDDPDILHQVVMGCDPNSVAEPCSGHDVRFNQIGAVRSLETGEKLRHLFGLDRDCVRPPVLAVPHQPIEERLERRRSSCEIEPPKIVRVQEPPFNLGRADEHADRAIGSEAFQIRDEVFGRSPRGRDRGPIVGKAAQHRRLPCRPYFVPKLIAVDAAIFGDRPGTRRFRHGA
jgi:hypothetical protein